MLHINKYPVWPDGTRKKQSGFGPLSGTLIEKYDARYALDPSSLVGGAIYGVPSFLWKNGDGAVATIGPAGVNLAASGIIASSVAPHTYPGGVDATFEEWQNGAYRSDKVHSFNPSATNDLVVAVKYYVGDELPVGGGLNGRIWASTYDHAGPTTGWGVYTWGGYVRFFVAASGGAVEATGVIGLTYRSYGIAIGVINRDGNSFVMQNGSFSGPAVTPAGTMTGAGIGLGADVSGAYTQYDGFGIEWVSIWQADGIYETWTADSSRLLKKLSFESMGMRETVAAGNKYWSFTGVLPPSTYRGSYQDHNGKWWLMSDQTPAAGDALGLRSQPNGNNTLPGRNQNIAAVDGGGAAGAVVDDSAQLVTCKARAWGPNVVQFANAGPADVYHYWWDAWATLTPSCISLLGRYVAGAGAKLGWYDWDILTFVEVATIVDGYVRTIGVNTTPPNARCFYCVKIPPGVTLNITGMQIDEQPVPTLPIPKRVVASLQRIAGIATTEYTPLDASGSLTTRLTPVLWSGNAPGSDVQIISRVGAGSTLLHTDNGTGLYATYDGTTEIASGAPAAGVTGDVWVAWRAALQYIQLLTGLAVTGPYDLSQPGAGALVVTPNLGASVEVDVQYIEIRAI